MIDVCRILYALAAGVATATGVLATRLDIVPIQVLVIMLAVSAGLGSGTAAYCHEQHLKAAPT